MLELLVGVICGKSIRVGGIDLHVILFVWLRMELRLDSGMIFVVVIFH